MQSFKNFRVVGIVTVAPGPQNSDELAWALRELSKKPTSGRQLFVLLQPSQTVGVDDPICCVDTVSLHVANATEYRSIAALGIANGIQQGCLSSIFQVHGHDMIACFDSPLANGTRQVTALPTGSVVSPSQVLLARSEQIRAKSG